jgi:hypothetical protein
MAPRLQLQALLESLLGSRNVYFQPPPTIQMKYPCIVYKRDYVKSSHADNVPYKHRKRYQVTIIDSNPDSLIPAKVSLLPTASFDRSFTNDQLNHDVYNLFF